MKKRLLALVLALCLVVGLLPVTAFAAEESITITFDNTSKRTEFDTSHQVWVENGITVTNNKAASTSNVADYAKPARFYASSSLTVAVAENLTITKIVFDCNTNNYATAMKISIGTGATASGDKVTIEISDGSNTFTVAKLTAQVRMDAMTVTWLE